MADRYRERERKFGVATDFSLPEPGESRHETRHLETTYYDTDDALLRARGVYLRRQVGGGDDGWYLTAPHPDGTVELHLDPGPTRPPAEFTTLTTGLRFGRPLRKQPRTRTTRDAYSKPDRAMGEPGERPPLAGVGGLVDDYLQAQYEQLAWGDFRLRQGENAVHKVRVAVRRTRSTLRIFAALFEHDRAARLDAELAWYAESLGRVRDLDVVLRTVGADLDSDPDGLVPPRAADRLMGILSSDRERVWEHLLSLLDGRRYRALLSDLDEWRRQAPMTAEATADPHGVEDFVRRAKKKSDKRYKRATAARQPADDTEGAGNAADEALHRARKAAKRTRYAAELAQPAIGKAAKRIAKKHEKRQDAWGAVQDHVTTIRALREIAARDDISTDVGFLCGALAQRHSQGKAAARAEG